MKIIPTTEKTFTTFASITPTRIVKYSRCNNPNVKDYSSEWELIYSCVEAGDTLAEAKKAVLGGLTSHNSTFGILSPSAKSRVNRAIDWMVLLAKNKETHNPKWNSTFNFKLNFVTLTLPSKQKHSDVLIKSKLLDNFLLILKRKFNVKNYFWRAEAQRNGNIHFHIITDVFIPYGLLRHYWNKQIESLNYVSNYFHKHKNAKQPPSTEVHSIKKVRNIASYLSKYCSKSSKGITVFVKHLVSHLPKNMLVYPVYKVKKEDTFYRQIYGKLWGCNTELSKLCKCRVVLSDSEQVALCVATSKSKIKYFEYATMYFFELANYVGNGLDSVRNRVAMFVKDVYTPLKIAPES